MMRDKRTHLNCLRFPIYMMRGEAGEDSETYDGI
jgi:hypothetical protein